MKLLLGINILGIVKNFPEDRRTYEVVSDSVADQRIFARRGFHANFTAKNGLVLDPLRVQDKLTNIKSRRRKWDKISHTLRSIHCENKIFLSLIFTWEGAERQTKCSRRCPALTAADISDQSEASIQDIGQSEGKDLDNDENLHPYKIIRETKCHQTIPRGLEREDKVYTFKGRPEFYLQFNFIVKVKQFMWSNNNLQRRWDTMFLCLDLRHMFINFLYYSWLRQEQYFSYNLRNGGKCEFLILALLLQGRYVKILFDDDWLRNWFRKWFRWIRGQNRSLPSRCIFQVFFMHAR